MLKTQSREGKLVNMRLVRNESCCVENNYINMSNMNSEEFSDSNFNTAVIDKISIFQEIASSFTYSEKINF